MTTTSKTEAERLADALWPFHPGSTSILAQAAAELRRLAAVEAERDALREQVAHLRGSLGAASGWIVEALKVLDTLDPDDYEESELLLKLIKAGEVIALAAKAGELPSNAYQLEAQR